MGDKNKVEVKIQGKQYTIVAPEADDYIYRIASYVDRKISEVSGMNARLSMDMAAVLAAINVTDELFKSSNTEDNLRKQILEYVDEAKKHSERIKALEIEISEMKKSN